MNSISIRVNLCRAACQQLKLWPWLMASINSAASYYSSFFKCFRNFIKAALNCKCVSLPRPSVLLSSYSPSFTPPSIFLSHCQLPFGANYLFFWLVGSPIELMGTVTSLEDMWGWETDFNLRILFVISACLINVSLLWWCWSFACCVDLLVNATWTSVLAKKGGQGSSLRGYQVSSPTACAKLANDIVNMANIAGPGLDTPSSYPSPWRPANPQKNVQCRHHLQLLLIPFSLSTSLSFSVCVVSFLPAPFSSGLTPLRWHKT